MEKSSSELRHEAFVVVLRRSAQMLDLVSFKRLAMVSRWGHNLLEAVMGSAELPCGPRRFHLWRNMIDLDDSSQFKKATERDLKEMRRRPPQRREKLEVQSREVEFRRYMEMAKVHETTTRLTNGVYGEVWRDVARTLPTHPFFREEGGLGQTMLGRILTAVAAACPETGYCQGMNYLVAGLIMGRLPVEITGGLGGALSPGDDATEEEEEEEAGGDGGTNNDNNVSTVGASTGKKQQKQNSGAATTTNTQNESKQRTKSNKNKKQGGLLTDLIETFTADANVLYEEDRLDAEYDIYQFVRQLEQRGSKFGMVGMWAVGTYSVILLFSLPFL
jgi:hypothetical protein